MIYQHKRKSRRWLKLLAVLVLVAVLALGYNKFFNEVKEEAPKSSEQSSIQENPQSSGWHPAVNSYQQVVESWAASHKGTYSIVITNANDGTELANYQGDAEYFTASIYKLFVVYVGYQKIDDGTYNPDEKYVGSLSRAECLDEAIRSSYSPCAEKWWAELGKTAITEKMESYGLTRTSLVSLTTTAKDASIILERIALGKDLSEKSRDAFLDSMKTQEAIYRRGLPSGFTGPTVYNKVGWNLDIEWHDAAIVDFGEGKKLAIAVLTKNAGMTNVADLAKTIQANLPN